MTNIKIINKQRYFFYNTFDSYRDAYNKGRYYKRKRNSKYYIEICEDSFGDRYYKLYLNKIVKFWM